MRLFFYITFTVCYFIQNTFAQEPLLKIGMSNALTGPAQKLGTEIKTGAETYFAKINKQGGVYGQKLKLISYDDGYEPMRTILNTKKLIEEDQVFLLFNYIGTPTSKVAVPIAMRKKIPYITPFTGADFLRNTKNNYVVNLRASYFDETERLVAHLTAQGIKKIGVFIQDDGYGNAGRQGVLKALKRRGLIMSGVGKYKRNTTSIEHGLNKLMKANPEAVIMIGAYEPCAKFIKTARAQGFNPVFNNISFVGTQALAKEVGNDGHNTYVSQVMPHPRYSNLPIVEQYRKDMKAAGHSALSFTSLEGYVNAVFLVELLKHAGKNASREQFITSAQTFKANLGGLQVTFSKTKNQGMNNVYLTRIQNGKVVPIK